MCEIGSIEIPHAVTKLDAMVTRQYLCTLMQIAYIFEKVKTQRIDDDIVNMKRDGPTLTQLENMLSKKRDRNLPCAVRF
jgi:hypothetical protein